MALWRLVSDSVWQAIETQRQQQAQAAQAKAAKAKLKPRGGRKGKSTIEVAAQTDLIPTLELLKRAVEAGELDTQIESASNKLREGFVK